MIEIEEKIMLQKREAVNTNVDEFMSKLNYRIETSKTNRQIFLTSSVMVLLILLWLYLELCLLLFFVAH